MLTSYWEIADIEQKIFVKIINITLVLIKM